MKTGAYERLATAIGEAVHEVERAIAIRDAENIEEFGDLALILAELKNLRERANTTRFADERKRGSG